MNRTGPIDTRTRMSRRSLLRGLSAITVALSTPIWRSATAFGQDTKQAPIRRFIGVFSANGTIASAFFPALSASAQPGVPSDQPLTLMPILEPLAKYKSRMSVLHGVHMNSTIEDQLNVAGAVRYGGPHMKGPGAMLTGGTLLDGSFTGSGGPAGWADRISVDQFIANRFGNKTAFPSLEFGVRIEGQEPLRVISYRGANQPNTALDDPWQMYTRLFGNSDLSQAELLRLIAERKSVLDFLKDDISRLSAKLESSDRARLDAQLTGLRGIEQRLSAASNTCKPLTLPEHIDTGALENFPTVAKLQMDLMLLAHACDLTRVSTFMFGNADSWQFYPWIGVNEEHHELSHAGDDDTVSNDKLIKINRWHSEQILYMLDGLAAAHELDGTSQLDNTVLLWGNELGAGNSHTYKNIPWLLAGGAGALRMGRYIDYQDQPHNNLLVSICHAMGFSDVTSFGIPGVCTGPLAGLST